MSIQVTLKLQLSQLILAERERERELYQRIRLVLDLSRLSGDKFQA